jgi:hypothetical protein
MRIYTSILKLREAKRAKNRKWWRKWRFKKRSQKRKKNWHD